MIDCIPPSLETPIHGRLKICCYKTQKPLCVVRHVEICCYDMHKPLCVVRHVEICCYDTHKPLCVVRHVEICCYDMQKPLCVVRHVERPLKTHFVCFKCPHSVQKGNFTQSFSNLRDNIRTQNLQLQIPR
jgi:hypothetical protein